MIGIVNYGMGNLASVQNALSFLELPSRIISSPSDVSCCDRIIIPGVGAFAEAMQKIESSGFKDGIAKFALQLQRPVLGICLGMQLMLESSTEHRFSEGLSLVSGTVNPLQDRIRDLAIPHVGWNNVTCSGDSMLMKGISEEMRTFYFVHSYYCKIQDTSVLTGQTHYGFGFDVIFEAGHLYGVQFHPEKSQSSGLTLLRAFGSV